MSLLRGMADLLFPPKCPFCGHLVDRAGLCPGCLRDLPWTRGEEVLRKGAGFGLCAAPLFYEGPVRDGLLRLKFGGAPGVAASLGELIAACAAEEYSGSFDCVTWVPVSRKRLRQRGYDQSRLLAEAACRLWATRPERLLDKTVDNPAQSGIKGGPAARRANVLGVYQAADPGRIKDRSILLIDDILTTGSTLSECVRVLRESGAKSVVCAVIAMVRPGREKEKNSETGK